MPLGTTLLHSPGCNEGKARNETLGTHRQKQIELQQGAALTARAFVLDMKSAAPLGLNKCVTMITQGLRPGLCRSIALTGIIYVLTANQLFCCFDTLTLPNE